MSCFFSRLRRISDIRLPISVSTIVISVYVDSKRAETAYPEFRDSICSIYAGRLIDSFRLRLLIISSIFLLLRTRNAELLRILSLENPHHHPSEQYHQRLLNFMKGNNDSRVVRSRIPTDIGRSNDRRYFSAVG